MMHTNVYSRGTNSDARQQALLALGDICAAGTQTCSKWDRGAWLCANKALFIKTWQTARGHSSLTPSPEGQEVCMDFSEDYISLKRQLVLHASNLHL